MKVCEIKGYKGMAIIMFLLLTVSCTAQEVVRFEHFPSRIYGSTTVGTMPPDYTDEIYEHNGKFYWLVKGIDNRFNEFVHGVDIHEIDEPLQYPGQNDFIRSDIILEYTPTLGFTDYVLLNHAEYQGNQIAFDGDRIMIVNNRSFLAVQDSIIVGDIDSLYADNQPSHFSYVVYDMKEDKIISSFTEEKTNNGKYYVTSAGLKGDYIYTVSTNPVEYYFMGDTLDTFDPDDFYSSNTHISKIHHGNSEKIWSYHIADTASGNYFYSSSRIYFDENENIIVQFRSRESSQYKGEFLNDLGGIYDLEFYRIDTSGELLDHQRIHAPFDEAIRDYKVNADGSIDAFGRTRYPQWISISNDTFHIDNEGYQGIAIHLNKDWQLEWARSFKGNESTTLYGMNSWDGETLLYVPVIDTVFLDDTIIVNPHLDVPPEYKYSEYGEVILKYNSDGERIGEPVFYANETYFYEFFQISSDHYLILLESNNDYYGFEFLGTDFGLQNYGDYLLLEIKGDLFDVLNHIDDINQENAKDINVFPNPLMQGEYIHIRLPEKYIGKDISMRIFDNLGRIKSSLNTTVTYSGLKIETGNLSKGMNHLQLKIEDSNITKSIIIQ